MSRFSARLLAPLVACLQASIIVTACLPDEGDVSQKYNDINQRAQIENTGLSLIQSANDMTAWIVAKSLVRRNPLSDEGLTTLYTVAAEDNPEPKIPDGINVVTCRDGEDKDLMATLSYFTAEPKGIPPLKVSSATMTKALVQRFGGKNVGLQGPGGKLELPKVAVDLGCTVGSDILAFSPIFASGFEYKGYKDFGYVLPDPNATTWPTVKRDITMPCPSGFNGVVKREQKCRLITGGNKREKVKVPIGDVDYENQVRRLEKSWECNLDMSTNLSPTADEIATYCRDPNAGLTKQADNTINMNTASLKKILETGAGEYTFKCRRNADGTNSCDAQPYNPNGKVPKGERVVCRKEAVPERYVINPIIPVQVEPASGEVISETPTATKTGAIVGNRSCGQGWTGDLIAGYEVRACHVVRIDANGVETPMSKLSQTIYKIGYVGARCNAPPKEAVYDCPHPYDGELTLREANYMTKPLALQLGTAPVGEWSPSTIPYSIFGGFIGNANAETKARSAQEDYIISNRVLQGVQNPTFSSRLETAMRGFMKKEVTGCKLTEQTCELPPDPIDVGIVFDRSTSMLTEAPLKVTSNTNRMECRAELGSIFTDQEAACALLRDNARDEYPPDGRRIESILADYLVDRFSSVFNNMMMEAITNKQMCGEVTVDKVGYCKPGDKVTQSSCSPGRCTTVGSLTDNKVVVSEDQLKTAINYFPPGSHAWFTQYAAPSVTGTVEPTKDRVLCNYVTDSSCDFAAAQSNLRDYFLSDYKGSALAGGTPLIEASDQTLKKMFGDNYATAGSTKSGILLFFTDGAETDDISRSGFRGSYPYPFGSLCESKFPGGGRVDGGSDEFCRYIGVQEGSDVDAEEVLARLQPYYASNDCANPQKTSTPACANIRRFYDGDKKELEGDQWKECLNVGSSTRPTFIDFVTDKLPNLRVFILNLGSRQLANCPSDPNGNIQMVDVEDSNGYQKAFNDAFKALHTKPANPQDVCQRVREKSFSNAVSY
jgi:hypothetical protein